MNCHLLVPNLFWAAAAGTEPYRGLDVPALELLLARGRRLRTGGTSLERWLAGAWSLPAGLPLAPYALRGEGGEPGGDCWMHADPVHLELRRDRLVLADAARLRITSEEARDFTAALGAHFAAEGIEIIAPDPRRWYLRIAEEPNWSATPTSEVAGRSVGSYLPSGNDGARWCRVINEAQMLLHDHPLNRERETRNEPPVNSIWLWGAGRTRRLAAAYDAVWSDHPLATGLATASGVAARRLPASGAALRQQMRGGSQLVVLSSLPATACGDLTAWRAAVSLLEQNWFAPLLARLMESGSHSITLHGLGPDFGHVVECRRRDRLRFWHRTRPLHAYAA